MPAAVRCAELRRLGRLPAAFGVASVRHNALPCRGVSGVV